jgi:arsenite-transporting ATPase
VASAFRAFSRLLGLGRTQHVVIDTAPTGHTLLLLDVTGAFHCHVMRDTTVAPLMRLQSPSFSRDVLVTLAETTPVAEAAALQDDLRRANIEPFGWVLNAVLAGTGTTDRVLQAPREPRASPDQTRCRRRVAAVLPQTGPHTAQ